MVVIEAIENAQHIGCPLAQHAFEAEALLGLHDFFGIRRAHGGYLVGKNQGAFQKIDAAIIFQKTRCKIRRVQLQERPGRLGKDPLKPQIVDRENVSRRSELGIAFRLGLQKYHSQRGLPVVAMDDIGSLAAHQLESGAAEEREALGVVGIIAGSPSVEMLAIEVLVGANQVNRNIFAERRGKDRRLLRAIADCYRVGDRRRRERSACL